jgi:hypothetical protein
MVGRVQAVRAPARILRWSSFAFLCGLAPAGDSRRAARVTSGYRRPQIVYRGQIQPELCSAAEVAREPHSGIGSDAPAFRNDVTHARRAQVQNLGKRVWAQTQGAQVLITKHFAGVNRPHSVFESHIILPLTRSASRRLPGGDFRSSSTVAASNIVSLQVATLQRRPNNMVAVRWGKEGASAFEVIIPFFKNFKELVRTFSFRTPLPGCLPACGVAPKIPL